MTRIAEKLALKVKNRRQRHSCLILKGGRILSQANNDKGFHAEQLALNLIIKDLHAFDDGLLWDRYKGATLISFRIAPNGGIGKSKPCVNCQRAIKLSKIRKVIYYDGSAWVEEFL